MKILAILLALNISSVIVTKQISAQQTNVSFQVFYDQLSPYGQWVNYSNYGYVWIPDAGSDFAPYSTGGHWVMTDYGWTWVSDYNWGWAPYHYGRWGYDDFYGWYWVPDNEWGPSWVTWRRADGYYGWEPMEPGVSISISFGREYNSHNDHWMFVRDRDFERTDINRYYVNRNDHDRIIRNSRVINKTYVDKSRHTTYVSGPDREDVQKVTGRKISTVAIQENNKPGQVLSNGQLRIYRPQVNKNNDKGQKPAPSRIANLKDVQRHSEGYKTNQQQNVNPQNNNNGKQPSQKNNVNPQDKNKKEQHQNTVKPQNNDNNKVQPSQPRNVNPQDNNKKEQQQKALKQENTNSMAQPSQPQKSNPSNNNGKEQHQNTVKPQDNNNDKVQPSQPRNVNPQDNNKKEQQQKALKQENTNSMAQPSQPQKSNPSDNNRQEQQQNTAKPQNNNNNKAQSSQQKDANRFHNNRRER